MQLFRVTASYRTNEKRRTVYRHEVYGGVGCTSLKGRTAIDGGSGQKTSRHHAEPLVLAVGASCEGAEKGRGEHKGSHKSSAQASITLMACSREQTVCKSKNAAWHLEVFNSGYNQADDSQSFRPEECNLRGGACSSRATRLAAATTRCIEHIIQHASSF